MEAGFDGYTEKMKILNHIKTILIIPPQPRMALWATLRAYKGKASAPDHFACWVQGASLKDAFGEMVS